jgi:hypothetical protein
MAHDLRIIGFSEIASMSTPSPEATAHAVRAASPIVTRQSGVSWGSISGWGTLIVAMLRLASAYLVFLPKYRAVMNKRLDTLDHERRDDMIAMRAELAGLREDGRAVRAASEADTRSAVLRAVVSMLTAEISRTDPANPVLQRARKLSMIPKDRPMNKLLCRAVSEYGDPVTIQPTIGVRVTMSAAGLPARLSGEAGGACRRSRRTRLLYASMVNISLQPPRSSRTQVARTDL